MKYTIEIELPDNPTVLKEIKYCPVHWQIWGFSGDAKAKPKTEPQTETEAERQYRLLKEVADEAWMEYEADKVTDEPQTDELDKAVEYADKLLGESVGTIRLLKGSDCPWK